MRHIIRSRSAGILGMLLLGSLLALLGSPPGCSRAVPLDDWEVDDLVNYLRARGLEFRAVPVMEERPLSTGVYLTTTNKPPEQLRSLWIVPEHIGNWEGTVFCCRLAQDSLVGYSNLSQFGGDGERQGPFFFFGDPALRARIDAALRDRPGSGDVGRVGHGAR
jgi:hypothetical protein